MKVYKCRCQLHHCTRLAVSSRHLMFVSIDHFTHPLSFVFISGMQITLIVPPVCSSLPTMTITNVFILWKTLLTTYTEAKNKVRHVCHTVINVLRLTLMICYTQQRCQIRRWGDFIFIITIHRCNTRRSYPHNLTHSINHFHTLNTEIRCLVYVDQGKAILNQRR